MGGLPLSNDVLSNDVHLGTHYRVPGSGLCGCFGLRGLLAFLRWGHSNAIVETGRASCRAMKRQGLEETRDQ